MLFYIAGTNDALVAKWNVTYLRCSLIVSCDIVAYVSCNNLFLSARIMMHIAFKIKFFKFIDSNFCNIIVTNLGTIKNFFNLVL